VTSTSDATGKADVNAINFLSFRMTNLTLSFVAALTAGSKMSASALPFRFKVAMIFPEWDE